ncbi:CRISPR-associated protein Cas4 [Haloferax volcanii]|uniref:CRISPR-associated exonuclease Cas4 n=3 Tax=Haloferax volcanii TaxID=2246 RepID=CAS4_HALVD|nr:CRISPR-associated protein Cas4 [Haloferax volcanii]D4GQN9.1 RecName: Full=CRISPR-associated exonuclease Cas4 [Haloferax volcanii DS2]ADE02138.1 CRISPR-associated exonuclease Cas4 [Haloferax volcanii DS2]MBS8120515.1 CRISPR-associated protein Cas4 [Haloferax volcanii]MBS8125552.1 CRISPR-associated protein Cas4 [Haloferax volcanii]MBS8129419.1 CRISPR-associated protein Cas4 [Haloferax volcanii]MBS8133284.1 CRISPR-associated protein Cas4 [Haloferax volcanii]
MSSTDVVEEYVQDERDPSRSPNVPITGLMVQYYHVCKRELWFMANGIDIDRETTNIQRGTHVDETSYGTSRRSFMIDNRIQLDILDSGDVMEVKVSSALEKPARMQLLFYLWYLREIHDIDKDGVLAYPTERKRESVVLDETTTAEVESTVRGVLDVVGRDSPPQLEKKPYCGTCLYQDLCWM